MSFLRKYGVAATLDGIPLVTRGAMDYKSSPTLATGDVTISKDGGAFANLATLPVVTPAASTSVQVALSATEMAAARVVVRFIDQTSPKEWEDQEIIIETYGNASAQHAFDLNTATQGVNVTQIGGDAQSATDLKDFADAGYDPATNKVEGVKTADALTANNDKTGYSISGTKTTLDALNDLSAAAVNAEVDTAIADARLDELLAADSDIDGATPPAVGSVFHELLTKTAGSFTYDQATDSLEALRDRGDAAWITATGFSTHSAADVWAVATRALTDKAGFSLAADQSAVTFGTVNTVGDKTGYRLSAAGVDDICDEVMEGTLTWRQITRLFLSTLCGKSAGGGTATLTFRDNGDTKNRISETVDSNGNRTAVTLDGT